MQDFKSLAGERFSARKFTAEPVSKEDLEYIMECVRLAPSACNRQPWKWLIVRSEQAMKKLQECYDREWFKTAPMYIVGMKNTEDNWVRKYDNKPHGDIDVAIAAEHLCLAATERGLGTCWVCAYDSNKMKELFPREGYEIGFPVCMLCAGSFCPKCHMALWRKWRKLLCHLCQCAKWHIYRKYRKNQYLWYFWY